MHNSFIWFGLRRLYQGGCLHLQTIQFKCISIELHSIGLDQGSFTVLKEKQSTAKSKERRMKSIGNVDEK